MWKLLTNTLLIIDPDLFKTHQLPLARVKKIMKSDEDVRVIFYRKLGFYPAIRW